ncbi:MAG: TetR/AcrR family transcriptional regulator [Nitrospinota bacterium]|nr:TetR/AcrR family transcriptional regulator [Nitrospinota bacterium]
MPKVDKAYLEQRRAQILKSAKACFAKNGFHKTTMRDIMKKSNLSSGALYRYFKSKEDIIEAIALQTLEANIATIDDAKRKGNARSQIETLADRFFSLLEKPEEKFTSVDVELWGEASRNKKVKNILVKSIGAHHAEFVKIILQAQANGEIRRNVDPESMASVMIALFQGAIVQMRVGGNLDLWKYVACVKEMLATLLINEEEVNA